MKELLTNVINKKGGAISYADYINLVLYHPQYGYYMKRSKKIGKKGDFITTSYVSTFFGEIFYKIFKKLVDQGVIPPLFIELGAGEGNFLSSFVKAWEKDLEKMPLQLIVVEKSAYHRECLKLKLDHQNLSFHVYDTIENIDININGFIFSNELFDALPVHVIQQEQGEIFEIFIAIDEQTGHLVEVKKPLRNEEILKLLKQNWISIQEGQRLEVSLDMLHVLNLLDKKINQAIVTTVDYGYFADEYKLPTIQNGTLRGYINHLMIHHVLKYPFKIDITSHVHFGLYQKKCLSLGWKEICTRRQDQFLIEAGILDQLVNHTELNPFSEVAKQNRAIRSLIMPGSISESFHVVIHGKEVEISEQDLFIKKTGNSLL